MNIEINIKVLELEQGSLDIISISHYVNSISLLSQFIHLVPKYISENLISYCIRKMLFHQIVLFFIIA